MGFNHLRYWISYENWFFNPLLLNKLPTHPVLASLIGFSRSVLSCASSSTIVTPWAAPRAHKGTVLPYGFDGFEISFCNLFGTGTQVIDCFIAFRRHACTKRIMANLNAKSRHGVLIGGVSPQRNVKKSRCSNKFHNVFIKDKEGTKLPEKSCLSPDPFLKIKKNGNFLLPRCSQKAGIVYLRKKHQQHWYL